MTLTDPELRRAILEDDQEARTQFVRDFRPRLNAIVREAGLVHRRLERFSKKEDNERNRLIYMYLHAALNNVCSSTSLLVAGYPLPSGHLMRQYGECVAMALLIVDQQSGVFEAVQRDPIHYKVSGVLHRLDSPPVAQRLRHLLGFTAAAWTQFKATTAFYHNFSHASVFALLQHVTFEPPDRIIIGAHYDPGKRPYARKELTARRSALRRLNELVRAVARTLRRRPRVRRVT